MTTAPRLSCSALAVLVAAACSAPRVGVLEPMTPPPLATGELRIAVAYPRTGDSTAVVGDTTVLFVNADQRFPAVDSVFLFGTVGRGDADLTINGRSVEVFPTGAWLAWLPLEADSAAVFRITARADGDTRHAMLSVPVVRQYQAPQTGAWIDTTSFQPRGDLWVGPDEGYALSVRVHPDAEVALLFPDGSEIPLIAETGAQRRSWGQLAFGTDGPSPASRSLRFALWHRGVFGPSAGAVLAPDSAQPPADSRWVRVRAVVAGDTVVEVWPLRVTPMREFPPVVAYLDDDRDRTGGTDGVTPGRPSPTGTYHWFFPNGTVARVSGRLGTRARLQLSGRSVAWVEASELVELPPGTPPPAGTTNPIRLAPGEGSVLLRLPLDRRYPFRVDEFDRSLTLTIYGVAADMDWLQYGGTDPLVRRMSFSQPTSDEVNVSLELSEPVWGYRAFWNENVLTLEIRRPPSLDPDDVLRGVVIALDAGHPPAGSMGPTFAGEWDVTLEVARKARELFISRGAEVVMVRDSRDPMGLTERVDRAEAGGAHVLVSIHANALPDGVNPFTNNGTSVYYYQPRSVALARELDRALVRQFGVRDLGIGRADLALARPTWMPAALTEGLFMMLPEQEAMLTSAEGQRRYAAGIVAGVEAFLQGRLRNVR